MYTKLRQEIYHTLLEVLAMLCHAAYTCSDTMVSFWHVMTAEQGSLEGLMLTTLPLTLCASSCQEAVRCGSWLTIHFLSLQSCDMLHAVMLSSHFKDRRLKWANLAGLTMGLLLSVMGQCKQP